MINNLRPNSKYKTEYVRTIAICTRHSMRLKMRLSGPSMSRDVRPIMRTIESMYYTIRKAKVLSKNSILIKLYNFLVKSKFIFWIKNEDFEHCGIVVNLIF